MTAKEPEGPSRSLKHSLDIIAFKSVSVVVFPIILFSLVNYFIDKSVDPIIGYLFIMMLGLVGYYVISGIWWITWGFITVAIAKKCGFNIPMSLLLSSMVIFVMLAHFSGIKTVIPVAAIVLMQKLAFAWYYHVNETLGKVEAR